MHTLNRPSPQRSHSWQRGDVLLLREKKREKDAVEVGELGTDSADTENENDVGEEEDPDEGCEEPEEGTIEKEPDVRDDDDPDEGCEDPDEGWTENDVLDEDEPAAHTESRQCTLPVTVPQNPPTHVGAVQVLPHPSSSREQTEHTTVPHWAETVHARGDADEPSEPDRDDAETTEKDSDDVEDGTDPFDREAEETLPWEAGLEGADPVEPDVDEPPAALDEPTEGVLDAAIDDAVEEGRAEEMFAEEGSDRTIVKEEVLPKPPMDDDDPALDAGKENEKECEDERDEERDEL